MQKSFKSRLDEQNADELLAAEVPTGGLGLRYLAARDRENGGPNSDSGSIIPGRHLENFLSMSLIMLQAEALLKNRCAHTA